MSFQDHYGNPKPSEMDLKQAVKFALRLLMTASEFDSATGGVNPVSETYATIKIQKSTGVETISDQQQKEFLQT
jgi:proteasome beta subunit